MADKSSLLEPDQTTSEAPAYDHSETLSGDEVEALLKGEEIDRSESAGPTGDSGRRSSVPSSGKPAKGKGTDSPGGLEPEPQPET